jgi:hypothetical protein
MSPDDSASISAIGIERTSIPLATIDLALAAAEHLLGRAEALGVALADIDLPPTIGGTAEDQAHLRGIATVYLAAELESALLVPAAELLASLAVSGGLPGATGDFGRAANAVLAGFWHDRHRRMTAAERGALFARLFGTEGTVAPADQRGINTAFDELFIDLCEALFKLDEAPAADQHGGVAQQARLRSAAGRLADNLLHRTGSMTIFAARDLLTAVQAALVLFKQHAVQQVFGTHSLWAAVEEVGRRYLHEPAEAEAHVTRAKDGTTILAWLADALPLLNDVSQPLTTLDSPAIAAATEWLQTSLGLSERASPAAGAA